MSDINPNKDAVIIGAGISGLATAFRLQKAGLDVLLLEKAGQVGGAIHTETQDGFLVDCGPNSTLDTSPRIRGFIEEIGLQDSRVYANDSASRRYILRDGLLQPLPMNPPQFLASKLFSTRAKFRLLAEPFIAPAPEESEETIAEFVRRRLGTEFLEYAINPFIAGVYAGDPDRLSVRSAVAKIYALEKNYGSLIKGAIKGAKERKKRQDVDKTKARLFSFMGGMSDLTDRLATILGTTVRTNCSLNDLSLSDKSENSIAVTYSASGKTSTVTPKTLVFATPAYVTSKYLRPFDKTVASTLAEITYPPVAMVFLGFSKPVKTRLLDGFGFLIPKVEQRHILGTIWSSTIFPNRAPENGLALTVFVGGMRQPELVNREDEEMTRMVLSDLQSIMGLQGDPSMVRIKRWPKAIPQYELGHEGRINTVEAFEANHPGVFVSGNFRSGISVGDCLIQSETVAARVIDYCKHLEVAKPTSETV